jgi:hypothetical protein
MKYYHTRCGGAIDVKTKTCTRCKKKWNWFTWWFNNEIRPVVETKRKGER